MAEPRRTIGKGGNFRSTKSGAGMTEKGVRAYRRKNPGSKLKTDLTNFKVKPGTKLTFKRKEQDDFVKYRQKLHDSAKFDTPTKNKLKMKHPLYKINKSKSDYKTPDEPKFKKGGRVGKKFPDLSGDGKVTKKDILMGRGVIKK